MRIAVVSDIHGNRTAFEAVLDDLQQMAPDLIFHGGDLADSGSSPAEIVDRIRELGWPGVVGNTDEMLFSPAKLNAFASKLPQLQSMFAAIEEMAAASRAILGDERLTWLGTLPLVHSHGPVALVHGSPGDPWRAPAADASDTEMQTTYRPLAHPVAVYAHIHRSCIRSVPGMIIANTGSVSLSYDGDSRAAYLLLDDGEPAIRRVTYDLERETKALAQCGLPHAAWVARMLRSGTFQMP